MFLDFMKRRKRVKEAEVSSSCVTGQYKKSDESTSDNDRSKVNERCSGKENIVHGNMYNESKGRSLFNLTELFDKKSVIANQWETLRKSKHKSNDVKEKNEKLMRHAKNKDSIRLENHRKQDLYRSSPSLIGPELHFKSVNKRRSEGDKYFSSQLETGADVLQYTNWDTYGSLITLNFGEDDRIVKNELNPKETVCFVSESHSFQTERRKLIPTSDCESDIYEEIPENDDSGTFCDSDSGISSLYETIIKYQSLTGTSSNRNSFVLPETIKEDENELDTQNPLETLKVAPKLVHIFQRNYSIIHTSQVFEMDFDVLTKVPVWNNHLKKGKQNVSEIKQTMLKTVTRQQQFLRTMQARMKAEKSGVDESIKSLEENLNNIHSSKIALKFNRFIDQIDSLANLIFGLELKIANLLDSGKSTNNADPFKSRLDEAILIKVTHEETFNVIVNHLDARNQAVFNKMIKSKQRLICELRLVNQELFYLEMQLKILFMY